MIDWPTAKVVIGIANCFVLKNEFENHYNFWKSQLNKTIRWLVNNWLVYLLDVTDVGAQSVHSWSCSPVGSPQLFDSPEPALLLTRCRGVLLGLNSSILWRHCCNNGWYLLWQFHPVHDGPTPVAHLRPSTCLESQLLSHHEKEGLVTQALITPLTNEIMARVVPTGLFGRMAFITIIISENHKRDTWVNTIR